MEENRETVEPAQGEKQELTTDPAVLQAISILEDVVEEKIGMASDGKL